MKRFVAGFGILLAFAPLPGHPAASTAVAVRAFQFTPSGWATVDPFSVAGGAGTFQTPAGTAHDAPTIRRGDTLMFGNADPVPHTVTKLSGPAGTWTAVALAGNGSGSLTIPATAQPPFPLGTYVYRCTIHPGMRGAFTVTA